MDSGIKRIIPNHPIAPVLAERYASLRAGIGGEERVADIFLKHSFAMDHRIFHDISLFASNLFQVDTLFLTNAYALIFEVKNIGGKLKFMDDPPQLIRTRADGQVDGYDCPAAQVERNVELFQSWLSMRGVHLPVYGVVVLAYPKQIVERAPAKTKILFPNLIPPFIRTLASRPIKLKRGKLDWLTAEISKSHQRYIPKPLCEIYNISKDDIRTGVECSSCGRIGMEKVVRTWYCPSCKKTDHLAYQKGIKEWFLLFGRNMSNIDCREFLHIKDIYTANRILKSMSLQTKGSYRNRTYSMDFNLK